MQQAEIKTLVDDFKTDFSNSSRLNRKTVADRSNITNLAALDLLADTVAEKNTKSLAEKARELQNLSSELGDITSFMEDLGQRSAQRK